MGKLNAKQAELNQAQQKIPLRYFQYGFPHHAGDINMLFKDKLKSTPEYNYS